ncbi:MAG: TatD family hydrolase [Thermoguttaceae bacterium]|jgi:TatD DNase family protein|nr:TatD family hydrolase [Thermoguttaceae bacterium]
MIDTHAHLDQPEFDADRLLVIDRALHEGVSIILCVGTSADSSAAAVQLATECETVYAAVGIQPNYVAEAGKSDWTRVAELAAKPQVVAIGETGLDRHWDFAPFGVQQDYFDRHLRLAQEFRLPVVVHCREAEADLVPMLRDAAKKGPLRGVLHSFSGGADFAEECLELGLFLSFSGMVTYLNGKFRPLREIARTVPEDRLLIETDSPYLVPHPLRGRQKRNEPAHLRFVAGSLAELRNVGLGHLVDVTSANARRLFSIGP